MDKAEIFGILVGMRNQAVNKSTRPYLLQTRTLANIQNTARRYMTTEFKELPEATAVFQSVFRLASNGLGSVNNVQAGNYLMSINFKINEFLEANGIK